MPTASAKPRKPRTVKATAAAKKSNRRTRDTPTTARVDASRLDSDGVLVVCVDDVLTKNERHRLATRRRLHRGQRRTTLMPVAPNCAWTW